jgi:antitoxin (DNA-binding transcriptional repressor) of toxin-antitoxin stability system
LLDGGQEFMIHFSIMKTATVADLRNHFRKVSAWIENGESVRIVKRGRAFARLVPDEQGKAPARFDAAAHRRRLMKTWGARVFSAAEVKAMRQAELEGEEG